MPSAESTFFCFKTLCANIIFYLRLQKYMRYRDRLDLKRNKASLYNSPAYFFLESYVTKKMFYLFI